jgi:hypothetical protein
MSEGALVQLQSRPAARPSTPAPIPAALSAAVAPTPPALGNAATARAATGGAEQALDRPPAVAPPPGGSPTDLAAQKADEVFTALDWLNQEEKALAALRGHGPAMRSLIQQRFCQRHGLDLAAYLRSQLDGDWLVRAFALLHSYNDLEQHTRLALALIPPGVRSEEVLQVLSDVAVGRRRELKALYELAFRQIGQGTLDRDLKAKLSGWRLQKSLALLDRDLTDADHLYFNSLAIVGTHTREVIELIQRRWANPGTFGELIQQWDDYVTNHKHWSPDPPWTTLTLYEAMDSELSGEDWLLVKAVLASYYKLKAGESQGKTREQAEEEARLQAAEDSLTATTTGERWWQGAGTNEAQAFRAITEIRKIWEDRIARNDEGAAARWAARRAQLERLLAGETTRGSTEDRQVQLLLKGKTTVGGTAPADEVYLASQAAEYDRVVQLVTQTWAEGKMAALITGAATPVLGPGGETLRPSYRLELIVPVTNTETWKRVILLTDARLDDATRGANRLEFEVDQGDDDSDLKKVHQLLVGIRAPGLRDAVIATYVKQRGLPTSGGATQAFLDHVRDRYASSYSYWLLLDLLEKSSDPTELYRRGLGRKAASETGFFHAIVQHFAERQDRETGEDTRAVVEESLATLAYVAQHQQGDPALATMQRLAGAADVKGLASKEYEGFTARLDRLRAQEQAIAEAIATAIELAVEAALTIATAGMAGGALLASLASTVAGMVAREALLGQDYTLTSRENAERIVAVFATAGMGHLGGELAKGALGAERVATRTGQFVQHVSSELMSQTGAMATKGAFSETGLTGGDLSAIAISGFASVLGAGTTGALKAGLAHDASLADKLAANVRAHLAGGTVISLGALASELSASGVGDLTAAEIAAMGGKRLGETAVRGTLAGLKDTAADLIAERREAAKYRFEEAETESTAKAAAPAATAPVPREYDNVLLLDVTPSQFEQVLAKLDESTPAAREIARRIRSGELHVTMTPEGFTPSDAGRATAKEIYVQWSPSVEETASTLVHEATHQADPALSRPGTPRSEIEATARATEYEFRARQGLEPTDAAERAYRVALADAQARGLPEEEARALARQAMVGEMRADPARYGVEGAAGELAPSGPPAAPPRPALFVNTMSDLLEQELATAAQLGVVPVEPRTAAFDAAIQSGPIKWVVLANGELRVVPKWVMGEEISHAVLSGGAPVQAAGEADIAGSAGHYVGTEIAPHSGHFLPSEASLETARDVFRQLGIEFPR